MPNPTAVVVPFVINGAELAARASQLLGLSNEALGKIAGCSPRTVSRWWSKESIPRYTVFQGLARAAFAKDAELAAELARAVGVTLEHLGLKSPSAAAPAVVAPPVAPAPGARSCCPGFFGLTGLEASG